MRAEDISTPDLIHDSRQHNRKVLRERLIGLVEDNVSRMARDERLDQVTIHAPKELRPYLREVRALYAGKGWEASIFGVDTLMVKMP